MAQAPRFTNVRALTERLNAIGKNTGVELTRALKRGAQRIETKAVESIKEQTPGGNVYPSKGNSKELHMASPPGSPPNADTGELDGSITDAMISNGPDVYTIQVAANTPYATALELGTSKMAPRPFMGPAFDSSEEANRSEIRAAIVRAARS